MQFYKQNPAAEIAPLGQGLVILEPGARKFCALNATSRIIWTHLKEPASLEQIIEHVLVNFQNVTADAARRDVEQILGEMADLGIVLKV